MTVPPAVAVALLRVAESETVLPIGTLVADSDVVRVGFVLFIIIEVEPLLPL